MSGGGYFNRMTPSSRYGRYENEDGRIQGESSYESTSSRRGGPARSPCSRSPSPIRRRRRSSSSDEYRRRYRHTSRKTNETNVVVMMFLPVSITENDISGFLSGFQLHHRSVDFRKNYDDVTVHAFVDLGSVSACKRLLAQSALGVFTIVKCRIKIVTEHFYNDQSYMGYHLYETPELPSALRSDSLARHLIDNSPCNVLIFKSLDYSATEDQVRESVTNLTTDPLYDVRVIKDKATGLSRGFCFVEMGTIADATKLLNIVLHRSPPYTVNNRRVLAGYARMSSYNSNGLGSLLPSTVDAFVTEKPVQTSQVANNAIAAAQLAHNPAANDSAMSFDPKSGFYYDSNSGFYYDPKSGYYYDSKNAIYLYYDQHSNNWITLPSTATDGDRANKVDPSSIQTSVPPTANATTKNVSADAPRSEDPSKPTPPAVTNDPKKIAKEMEKWAKKQKVSRKPPKNTNHTVGGGSRSAFQSVKMDTPKDLPLTNLSNDPFIVADRLLCLLCVRRFKSKRHLQNHLRLSQLHKDNILLFNARTIVSSLQQTHTTSSTSENNPT